MIEHIDTNIRREIEEVFDKKVKDNKSYYLIKWKGMKEKYNTWEKKETL